jgi:hypothetical protein
MTLLPLVFFPSISSSISPRIDDQSYIPNGHSWAGNIGQTDGARETLVTLGVVVLQTDLKLDGFEKVTLLLVLGVFQKLLDILAHSGCGQLDGQFRNI